jgi:hypothetical protein
MLGSHAKVRMQDYIAFGGPLADPSVWRGALLWAIALYVPLSGPLSAFEASLSDSPSLRQVASNHPSDQQPAAGPRRWSGHSADRKLGPWAQAGLPAWDSLRLAGVS